MNKVHVVGAVLWLRVLSVDLFECSASIFLSCWRNEGHEAVAAVPLGWLCATGATRKVGTVAMRK